MSIFGLKFEIVEGRFKLITNSRYHQCISLYIDHTSIYLLSKQTGFSLDSSVEIESTIAGKMMPHHTFLTILSST